MKPLLLTILICFITLTTFAEQPAATSEENYEIVIGATTYQDVLENFGHPLYTTKTEDGNQV